MHSKQLDCMVCELYLTKAATEERKRRTEGGTCIQMHVAALFCSQNPETTQTSFSGRVVK